MGMNNTTASNLSNKTKFAIIVGIVFFAAVFSEVVTILERRKQRKIAIAATDDDANFADANHSEDDGITTTISNNGLFTSMEGEFEWNRFMIPHDASKSYPQQTGGSSSSSVPAKDRETGRRLVVDRNPDASPVSASTTALHCNNRKDGNLRGCHRRGS